MALRTISQQLQHLKPLKDQPKAVSTEIVKLVLEYLNHEPPNSNRFSTLADKLNMASADLQLSIKALVLLTVESVKKSVSRTEFEEAVFACLAPEQTQFFWEFINSQREFILNILQHYTVTDLRYRDLEWRMDTKVASRSLLTQSIPSITMKLYLDAEEIGSNKGPLNEPELATTITTNNIQPSPQQQQQRNPQRSRAILLQTDPTNLSHVIDVLDQALDESKTHRTKIIVKSVQPQQQQQQK